LFQALNVNVHKGKTESKSRKLEVKK